MASLLQSSVLLPGAISSATTPPELASGRASTPFTMPSAVQYEFTARTNRLPYRLMVWAPLDSREKAYPVIYILDGNALFPAAAARGWLLENAIIVGIGVPSDTVTEWRRRRMLDLSPTEDRSRSEYQTGGGEAFTDVLLTEIKPFIESTYRVQAGHRTLYGLSMGGLMTAHIMFTKPQAFDTYVICSPSLAWNGNAVLQHEAAFAQRARAGDFTLRVLVTVAGNESKTMIDSAAELVDRLKQLPKSSIDARYAVFPDEVHRSVMLASVGRALTFALQKPQSTPRK